MSGSSLNASVTTLLAALIVCASLANGSDQIAETKPTLQVVSIGQVKLSKRKAANGQAVLDLVLPITFRPTAGCRIVSTQRVSGEIEVVYRDASGKAVKNPGCYTYKVADAAKLPIPEPPAVDAEVTIHFVLASQRVMDTPGYVWQADYKVTRPLKLEVHESNERVVDATGAAQESIVSTLELGDDGVKVAAK